ncbi:MAG: MBL fold metallo-hydrolase [Aeropyrum sp.]|nr:MBL fold metallo-hydrolase [Aeropyrum sp.]
MPESTVIKLAKGVWILLYPGLTPWPDSLTLGASIEDCIVLYDTGSGAPESILTLSSSLAEIGIKPWKIDYAIISHAHLPSSGGSYWLHDSHNTTIAARNPDSRWIETGDPVKTAANDYGLPFRPVPVGVEIRREGPLPGCTSKINVMFTPGHTPGSISLFIDAPDATIIAVADALGRLSRRWDSDEKLWQSSVEKIARIDADFLCTSTSCLDRRAASRLLEELAEKGAEWVD